MTIIARRSVVRRHILPLVRNTDGSVRRRLHFVPGIAHTGGNPMLVVADTYGNVLLGVAGVTFLAGLIGLVWISHRLPRGITLLIAVGIFVAGGLLMQQDSNVREVHLLIGTMRFLGFAGMLVGILDLVRKRPAAVQTTDATE